MKNKRTLRNMITEILDIKTATTLEPVVKKYMDRAIQDKSPDAQVLQTLAQEIAKSKQAQQTQQQQVAASVETSEINKSKEGIKNLKDTKEKLNSNVDAVIKNQEEEQKRKEEELKKQKQEELKNQTEKPNGNLQNSAQVSTTGTTAQVNTQSSTAQVSVKTEFDY